jgi:hypothetical protein
MDQTGEIMTIYAKAFFIGLVVFMTGCVYVNVSKDKENTDQAPLIGDIKTFEEVETIEVTEEEPIN